jgi:RNA polymerase sigma factor (sigma-70 family)
MRQCGSAVTRENGLEAAQSNHELSDAELLERFTQRRDEAAFEALVNRHGPMVEGVCRRIIGNAHAAEDVFQAVFLVLVRKSGTIRRPELLANWLYGVACRVARKARIKAIRNAARERWTEKMPTREQNLDAEWNELKQVLDEEMSQLPEKYRAPLVLCYLHGQTNAQAAAQLGWPTGSISERLSRAREMLRKRLTRRGLNLTSALLAVLLTQKASAATVSPALVSTTVKTAVSYAARPEATDVVSPSVHELVLYASRPMIAGYLKTCSVALALAVAIVLIWPAHGFSARFLWSGSGDINPIVPSPDMAGFTAGRCHILTNDAQQDK